MYVLDSSGRVSLRIICITVVLPGERESDDSLVVSCRNLPLYINLSISALSGFDTALSSHSDGQLWKMCCAISDPGVEGLKRKSFVFPLVSKMRKLILSLGTSLSLSGITTAS